MRSATPALAMALALAAGPVAAAAPPDAIAPGYWETTNEVVSPVRTSKVERRCIRAEDVARFMAGPSNHIYRCTYPTREIGPGTIRLQGSCSTREGPPLPVSGEGAFTADTFHLEARTAARIGRLTIPVRAVTRAHRLAAECPAEAP